MKFRHALLPIAALLSSPAIAQTTAPAPMSEVIGQPIVVTTNGVSNTLYFENGGALRIVTPSQNSVPATWSMNGPNLCINSGAASECWRYSPFQRLQPQNLTSSCNVQSTWTAQSINGVDKPFKGEKGR